MHIKKLLFLFLVALIILNGCVQPESPELRSIDEVKVEMISLKIVRLKSEAILYNPNKSSMVLKESVIDIELDGEKIASVNKRYDLKINRESEFTVPLEVDIQLSDLNLDALGAALGILSNKGKEIHFVGKIKVRTYGVPFTIPVDYTERLKISF